MRSERHAHGVLVPVYDGDITDSALARARAELDDPDTRLVLLHVVHPGRAAACDATPPRWRRLVERARPDRVLVDAVLDEPGRALAAYAERFGCDVIVADAPPGETRARHPHPAEAAC
jgi:hypothetical protein